MRLLCNCLSVLPLSADPSGFRLNFNFDFSGILGIAAYVLLSLGMYAIAKRRGIRKPWLSWLPFGNVWILGSISDQYQYVVKGQVKSKRKALLTLEILSSILVAVMMGLLIVMLVQLFLQMDMELLLKDPEAFASQYTEMPTELIKPMLGYALGMMALLLPLLGIFIAQMILQYMAYHDVFASCDPKNKTLFTTLGIIFHVFGLSVVLSVFVLICKDKDEGMPPRKESPAQPEPANPVFMTEAVQEEVTPTAAPEEAPADPPVTGQEESASEEQ